jgi:hypothetical protein
MGRMDAHMQMVAICQEFGWTYDEYMNQPNFFLILVKEKLLRDNKERELELKKARRK